MKLLFSLLPAMALGVTYTQTDGECQLAGGALPGITFNPANTMAQCEVACTNDAACTAYQFSSFGGSTGSCFTLNEAIVGGSGSINSQAPTFCFVKVLKPPTTTPTVPPTQSPVPLSCKDVNIVVTTDMQLRESVCVQNPACVFHPRQQKCKKQVIVKCKLLSQTQCVARVDCHTIFKKAVYKRCCSLDYGSFYNDYDNNLCDPNVLLQCKNLGEVDCRKRMDCTPIFNNNSVFTKCCNPLHGSAC